MDPVARKLALAAVFFAKGLTPKQAKKVVKEIQNRDVPETVWEVMEQIDEVVARLFPETS